jgi:hypothetical protein
MLPLPRQVTCCLPATTYVVAGRATSATSGTSAASRITTTPTAHDHDDKVGQTEGAIKNIDLMADRTNKQSSTHIID